MTDGVFWLPDLWVTGWDYEKCPYMQRNRYCASWSQVGQYELCIHQTRSSPSPSSSPGRRSAPSTTTAPFCPAAPDLSMRRIPNGLGYAKTAPTTAPTSPMPTVQPLTSKGTPYVRSAPEIVPLAAAASAEAATTELTADW